MITHSQFVLAQAMMCSEPNPLQLAAIIGVVGIALVGLGLGYAIIAGVATIIVQQILAGASIAVILTAVQAFLMEHGVALLTVGPLAGAIAKIQEILGC